MQSELRNSQSWYAVRRNLISGRLCFPLKVAELSLVEAGHQVLHALTAENSQIGAISFAGVQCIDIPHKNVFLIRGLSIAKWGVGFSRLAHFGRKRTLRWNSP